MKSKRAAFLMWNARLYQAERMSLRNPKLEAWVNGILASQLQAIINDHGLQGKARREAQKAANKTGRVPLIYSPRYNQYVKK